MGEILTSGGTGGADSDELTALRTQVLKGRTAITHDSDGDPIEGTLEVNNLLFFNCAAYSGRRILAKWQNPRAASGRPYSGIIIRYGTSGSPGLTGGTRIYKGAGNNTASGGQSQAYIDLPALNTTYYLSCYPYATCSAGEMLGEVINAFVKTSAQINLTIKGTQSYTVPAGYTLADIFCVGGGGGGEGGEPGSSNYAGNGGDGGGGGYTAAANNIPVSPGQVLACTVGNGGVGGNTAGSGGASSVVRSGTALCSASGGGNSSGGSGGGGGGNRGSLGTGRGFGGSGGFGIILIRLR